MNTKTELPDQSGSALRDALRGLLDVLDNMDVTGPLGWLERYDDAVDRATDALAFDEDRDGV
jgi:hypothetical protein